MREKSAEQQARDLLEQYGLKRAQSMSSGDVVELANLIADAHAYRHRPAYTTWTETTPRGTVQVTWNGTIFLIDGCAVPPERYGQAITTGIW